MFTSDLNAGVVPQMSPLPHDLERLRTTMVDFIVLSIKLVFMVLGVSYSQVLAQLVITSKEPVCPRVELILKIIIILLIIFLGFSKNKPC